MKINHPIHNPNGEKIDFTYLPGENDKHLVLLGHGLTGSKDSSILIAVAEALSKDGWPCLRFSFSGNGGSEGLFTDSNITKEIADLSAIIDQVGSGKKITYIGHSMGGAVGALTAARDDRIQRVVTLAGVAHPRALTERILKDAVPGKDFMKDDPQFPISQSFLEDLHHINTTLDAVKELRLPWLLIHGLKDDVVPAQESRDLAKLLRGPTELVEIPDADHTFKTHQPPVIQAVLNWFRKNL